MDSRKKKKMKNMVLQAAKIGLGSSVAIYVASLLNLQFQASAGTIALLTLMTTKWETLKLSAYRLITFFMSVLLAWLIFTNIESSWISYGLYIFIIIIMSESMGMRATISVNSVIGAHFMQTNDFSVSFIGNELMLVVIGIVIAILVNLFHLYRSNRMELVRCMRYTEDKLQMILHEMANYLHKEKMSGTVSVWDEIDALEHKLQEFIGEAYEYQDNTFQSHPQYYIDYFEMRHQQLGILYSLHHEMKRIRMVPDQANIVADYMTYLADYIIEVNAPDAQLEELQKRLDGFRVQPLPVTREEFESRAILYHILMDVEDFILFKKRFVDELDEHQLRRYLKQDKLVTVQSHHSYEQKSIKNRF